MKQRLTQWALIASALCLLSLLAALLFERAFLEVAEPMLNPWLGFCQAVTPEAWQTRGNVLLGLAWLLSGLAVYSVLIGAIFVVSAEGIKNFGAQKKRQ